MPIPTKSQPTGPDITSTAAARLAAPKRTISIRDQDKDKTKTSTSLRTPTNTIPTSTSHRLLPRPKSRDTTSASAATSSQLASADTTIINPATETTSASSRPSSTSSSTSRSAVRPVQTQSTRSTIKSRVIGTTASQARTTSTSKSTGTTSLDKTAPASKVSRLNQTSTAPSTTARTLRAPTAGSKPTTRTTSASSTATAKSTTSRSKPEPSLPSTPTLPTTLPPQYRANLTNELDQLRILHETSGKTLNEYKQSIAQHLTSIHASLQAKQTALIKLESSTLEALSTDALETWLLEAKARGHQPSRIIQTLSSTIQELDLLADDTGESSPLKQFATWLDEVLSIRAYRNSTSKPNPNPQGFELRFINPLGRTWTESMTNLRETLRDLQTTLSDLAVSNPDPDAGIGTLIARYRLLARTLLEEVETAITIERGIVEDEKGWESREIGRVMAELGSSSSSATRGDSSVKAEVGIWAR